MGVFALVAGLAACATNSVDAPRALQGEALQRALHGAWCNPAPGGGCWAHDLFDAGGRFASCGQAEGDRRPFRGAGTFRIDGQRMCYVVAQASDNFWLPAGARYCTEILSIGAQEHRYRDLDSGAVFTLKRQEGPPPACLGEP